MLAVKVHQVSSIDPSQHMQAPATPADQIWGSQSPKLMATQVLAAAGSAQASAAPITAPSGAIVHATGANATKGIVLPPGQAGAWYLVKNQDSANAVLNVYPPSGGAINALATNTAIAMAAKTACLFACIDGTTWFTFSLLPS